MKRITFFSTRIWVYLFDLPLILLFAAAVALHNKSTDLLKFYPLEILLGAAILFIPIYFFRAVTVSRDEIRARGLFSSRDKAVINKGKMLIVSLKSRRRMNIDLYGNDGQVAALDWLKNKPDYEPMDIYLFRGKALGGKKKAMRLLALFDLTPEDAEALVTAGIPKKETKDVRVTSEKKHDMTEIRIFFKETML